jgi:DNA-binding transcriptional regulator YdaS (Cro superfamily)
MNPLTDRPKNAALDEAISRFKSLTDMARVLEVSSYRVIQEWRRQGRVPAEHCPKIERAVGVPCEGLNDRVDWAFVRESGAQTTSV